jgi:hypothetical protein
VVLLLMLFGAFVPARQNSSVALLNNHSPPASSLHPPAHPPTPSDTLPLVFLSFVLLHGPVYPLRHGPIDSNHPLVRRRTAKTITRRASGTKFAPPAHGQHPPEYNLRDALLRGSIVPAPAHRGPRPALRRHEQPLVYWR